LLNNVGESQGDYDELRVVAIDQRFPAPLHYASPEGLGDSDRAGG
jgi:hypothetical protein